MTIVCIGLSCVILFITAIGIIQGLISGEEGLTGACLIFLTTLGISFATGYLVSSKGWMNEAVDIGAAEYKTDKRGGIRFEWSNPQYQAESKPALHQ